MVDMVFTASGRCNDFDPTCCQMCGWPACHVPQTWLMEWHLVEHGRRPTCVPWETSKGIITSKLSSLKKWALSLHTCSQLIKDVLTWRKEVPKRKHNMKKKSKDESHLTPRTEVRSETSYHLCNDPLGPTNHLTQKTKVRSETFITVYWPSGPNQSPKIGYHQHYHWLNWSWENECVWCC